tara:strand:+ start:963 stop:1103 length:141 start_codon:yes stop_codon:yes gene_type:complete
MKGQINKSNEGTYTRFVVEIACKLDKITIKEDSFVCETCKVDYKPK